MTGGASPSAFNLDGPTTMRQIVVEGEEDRQPTNVAADFLRYHQKFNHVSPKKIQAMAKRGMLPRRLANCPVPLCTACLYGKAKKRAWRSKPLDMDKVRSIATKPGKCVSGDQLTSPAPGLVAQVSGALTKSRYTTATVFVDHATDFGYLHFQRLSGAADTVEAKEAFERFASEHGVRVQHYHADNGVFNSNGWRSKCVQSGQGLTFAGVNAHHQRGRAERRIAILQDLTRTSLSHANRRLPTAITANLWPYAMRMCNDAENHVPNLKYRDGRTPMEAFGKTRVMTNPKHWHHFGCPAYVPSYKGVPEYFTNGKNARRWEFISDGCRSMPGWWHWCSTSPRVTSLHSSTSSLTPCSTRPAKRSALQRNCGRQKQASSANWKDSSRERTPDRHVPASCWFGHSSQSGNPASFRRRSHVRSCPSRG